MSKKHENISKHALFASIRLDVSRFSLDLSSTLLFSLPQRLDDVARTALAFTYEQSSLWQEAVLLTGHLSSPAAFGVTLAAYEKALAWPMALAQALRQSKGLNEMMANSLLSTLAQSLKWKIAVQLLGRSASKGVEVQA